VIAVLMAGFLGALVLYAAATLEPSDDPDEQDSRRLMWSVVVLWAVSAVIAIGSAGWAAARRLRKPTSQGAAPAAESGGLPNAAPGPYQAVRTGRCA
jgi:hypothetical protein